MAKTRGFINLRRAGVLLHSFSSFFLVRPGDAIISLSFSYLLSSSRNDPWRDRSRGGERERETVATSFCNFEPRSIEVLPCPLWLDESTVGVSKVSRIALRGDSTETITQVSPSGTVAFWLSFVLN